MTFAIFLLLGLPISAFTPLASTVFLGGGGGGGIKPEQRVRAKHLDIIKEEEDVVVEYVVLRRNLIDTWLLGSIITEGCHASVSTIWEHKDDPLTVGYCSLENIDFMHKVTLQVNGETQIVNLAEKLKTDEIAHRLWIEQPESIPTTKPYNKSAVSSYFKLKLCK